jgi:hypothetical protein
MRTKAGLLTPSVAALTVVAILATGFALGHLRDGVPFVGLVNPSHQQARAATPDDVTDPAEGIVPRGAGPYAAVIAQAAQTDVRSLPSGPSTTVSGARPTASGQTPDASSVDTGFEAADGSTGPDDDQDTGIPSPPESSWPGGGAVDAGTGSVTQGDADGEAATGDPAVDTDEQSGVTGSGQTPVGTPSVVIATLWESFAVSIAASWDGAQSESERSESVADD